MAAGFPNARRAFGGSYSQAREDWALFEQFSSYWNSSSHRGVFLEMGALDGWTHSNSLAYERWLNWTGVLIEANPDSCVELFERRRSGATVNLCTAISNGSSVAFERSGLREVFAAKDQMSAEYRKRWRRTSGKEVVVPGQPLGRLLRMVGLTHIDAFFLDVEGSELQVLRTFDWSLPVHVFCIETQPQTSEPTRALLLEHGYVKVPWRYAEQIRHKKRRQLLLQSELFVRREPWPTEERSFLWAPEPQWTPPANWARQRAGRARRQGQRWPPGVE